ncbi:MAG TPA: D-alanine--D-alanine ligase [Candidatus Fimiplasma intestinipullorum]|uniref:D-alanine--D-alanine ligase n=1 Tax=Candidatus Fimiplasma intestinipullorum TaxID=2840825 RepID=A0A9D1KYT3_9FIRM|nr:D-alanine--D-alanine ligase [Candidatus Fimiplasma intestinipullorum]
MKKRIVILFGGQSSEYAVSLESAASVIEHLDKQRYEPYLIGITTKGEWFKYEGTTKRIADDAWQQGKLTPVVLSPAGLWENGKKVHVDAILPIMHGKNGEDGSIQGLIQLSHLPLIGCDVTGSAICMDKHRAHQIVRADGIRVPNHIALFAGDPLPENLNYPLFVKPNRGGSSLGMSYLLDASGLAQAVDKAFQYDEMVLLEEEVKGFEVGCAVMGCRQLVAGEVDEIEVGSGFFDYVEKYQLKTASIHVPARLAQNERQKIQQLAKRIYRLLGCRGFARVDLFVLENGELVFNEVNTIPGFTSHSRFPSMMKAIGYDMTELLTILIEEGIKDANSILTAVPN